MSLIGEACTSYMKSCIHGEVMKMYEGINYQKEKRKKRFTQKDSKKTAADNRYAKTRRHSKSFVYKQQYGESWELINSR